MLRELILLIAIGSLVSYLRKLSSFDFLGAKLGGLVNVRWKSVYLIYLRI